jgi:hypothetical protein
MEQIVRYDDNGIIKWRDIYSGPHGSGYTDGEEKVENGVKFIRTKHTGPENRQDTGWDWVEVKETPLV